MNKTSNMETFYEIDLPNENKTLTKYLLNKKDNIFSYEKSIDGKKINCRKNTNNRMVKNIYYILKNITKLKDGKIKKYMISSELELEILCDFLRKNNIFYNIAIFRDYWNIYNLPYDEYKKNHKILKYYFNGNVNYNYEYNKISYNHTLYIIVYKGFVLLDYFEEKRGNEEIPKFGIYQRSLYRRF